MGHHRGETDKEHDRRKATKKDKKEKKVGEGKPAHDLGMAASHQTPAAPAAPAAPVAPAAPAAPAAPRTTAIYEDFLGEREEGLVYLAENKAD